MHLYVHVPFCRRRCSYCDFAIAVRREAPSEAFLAAVLREWEWWQSHPVWSESPRLETIYIGGGTPSRLAGGTFVALLSAFRAARSLAPGVEITLEVNPEDVTGSKAEGWLAAGINRISLGAQSFSAPALEWMHRTHDVAQIGAAVLTLRAAGHRNISLDLIYALPDRVARDWKTDLERALALEPEHLSLYGLTIEPGTALGRWTARGEATPLPDDRAAQEYLLAHELLSAAGFEHYEVSNAARPGFRSRHNSAYWNRRPYIGLGPSAHSGFDSTRSWNVREWEQYRRQVEAGRSVIAESETLQGEEVALEELYLGLRTVEGIAQSRVPTLIASQWRDSGWAEMGDCRVRLTPEGWLRLDALVASLTHC